MKVIVLGGTGLIGYHAVLELLERGHQVSSLALDMPLADLLPTQVENIRADLSNCSDERFCKVLAGTDAVVFAIGEDERKLKNAPAYEHLFQANVCSTERVVRLAAECDVQKVVICGSYFTYFERTIPEWRLSENHPYIRSRQEQANVALRTATNRFQVCILELPYVFGSVPGRRPLWTPLLDYLRMPIPTFYPAGGTTMIGVEQVGELIAGAVEQGQTGSYPVGDESLAWTEMIERFQYLMGIKRKKVRRLPRSLAKVAGWLIKFSARIRRREFGLDPVKFIDIHSRKTFISQSDLQASQRALGYRTGRLLEGMRQTVVAAPPLRYRGGFMARMHQRYYRLLRFAARRMLGAK